MKNRHTEVQRLLSGCPTFASIREVAVTQDTPVKNRTAVEDAVGALLPGDDPTGHPMHSEPNPYLFMNSAEIWDSMQGASPEELRLMSSALRMRQISHSDGLPGRPGPTTGSDTPGVTRHGQVTVRAQHGITKVNI
jgi:hypothetical protein